MKEINDIYNTFDLNIYTTVYYTTAKKNDLLGNKNRIRYKRDGHKVGVSSRMFLFIYFV